MYKEILFRLIRVLNIISICVLIYIYKYSNNYKIEIKINIITENINIIYLLYISLIINICLLSTDNTICKVLVYLNLFWGGLLNILFRSKESIETRLFLLKRIRNNLEKYNKIQEYNKQIENILTEIEIDKIINNCDNYNDIKYYLEISIGKKLLEINNSLEIEIILLYLLILILILLILTYIFINKKKHIKINK